MSEKSIRNESRVEEIIRYLEDMVETSKPSTLSPSKIVVNKAELLSNLRELRMKAPVEIKRCRKMMENYDAVLADAQDKANKIVNEAQMSIQNMVDEHEIVQQALQEADNILADATAQANELLYEANKEAEMMRRETTRYMLDNLTKMQNLVNSTMINFDSRYRSMMGTMEKYSELLRENKEEITGKKDNKSQPESNVSSESGKDFLDD